MKEWTREERYRVLKNKSELNHLYEINTSSVYRQDYHIQPITGLSNDPNGFIYAQGKWHLFYQWCPWGPVHGLKYWYHVTSEDLVHWTNEGIGLAPDTLFDNKGCYSGSAIAIDDEVYFYYTGNHRNEDWERTAYTCVAKLEDDGSLTKKATPLFAPREDYSEHQRDPMVVYNKALKRYFIFIGARSQDERGCALVYTSEKPLEGWSFAGELHVVGYEHFGGMWECPCITNIDGKDILIFSPQFTKLPGRGDCTNHNVYIVGHMDYETLTFTPESHFRYLDYGFDFYAAQTAANASHHPVMIAWMGLPDNHYPSEKDEWEGAMTLPRRISVEGDRLIQTPVKAIENLRTQTLADDGHMSGAMEMDVTFTGGDAAINLFTKPSGYDGLTIEYDAMYRMITVNKAHMDQRFNTEVFEKLDIPLDEDLMNMRIFIDHSSVELFINDGRYTFTAHVYPTIRENRYTHTDNMDLTIYALGKSVDESFIL